MKLLATCAVLHFHYAGKHEFHKSCPNHLKLCSRLSLAVVFRVTRLTSFMPMAHGSFQLTIERWPTSVAFVFLMGHLTDNCFNGLQKALKTAVPTKRQCTKCAFISVYARKGLQANLCLGQWEQEAGFRDVVLHVGWLPCFALCCLQVQQS